MKQEQDKKPAKTVDEYLADTPEKTRNALENLRKAIKAAAPEAEEVISYRIPTYRYHGPLVHFAAFKDHCSFIVVNKSLIETFRSELGPFTTSGATIHFSAENPLPASLVEKIVRARKTENETRAKK